MEDFKMDNSLGYIKKSGIKVKLADGKTHEIKYDMNALEYLQECFGDIKELYDIDLEDIKNIKIFLRAGLLHEFPENEAPSLFEIGKLVILMTIDIDGEIITYDLNSFEYLSEAFGVPMKDIMNVDLRSSKKAKTFLRAGILHNYPEGQAPSLFDVGKMFDIETFADFNTILKRAKLMMPSEDIEKSVTEALLKSLPDRDDIDSLDEKKTM
ncbi:MAG: hypothetical protein Q8920_04485 [Bacillota bacterium]|nr:hypothetical protein [Bacillota bacterium]